MLYLPFSDFMADSRWNKMTFSIHYLVTLLSTLNLAIFANKLAIFGMHMDFFSILSGILENR